MLVPRRFVLFSVLLRLLIPLLVVDTVTQAQGDALCFTADADVAENFVLLVCLAAAFHAQIHQCVFAKHTGQV